VSRRHDNKRRTRAARWFRSELVEIAGVAKHPQVRAILAEGTAGLYEAIYFDGGYEFRTSVPRSLRPLLGRFIGG
jgi:hypothetical protein